MDTAKEVVNEANAESFNKNHHSKKSRANMKQVYINLRQQIEFYFSAANISKDRFLAKLINENACKLYQF